MLVSEENGKTTVRCSNCNFRIFDGIVLKMRVGLIRAGRICIKCPQCKKFDESIPLTVFMFNKE